MTLCKCSDNLQQLWGQCDMYPLTCSQAVCLAAQLSMERDSVVMGACTSNPPPWAGCKMFLKEIAKSRLVRRHRRYAHQPDVWNWSLNWTTWADGLLCENRVSDLNCFHLGPFAFKLNPIVVEENHSLNWFTGWGLDVIGLPRKQRKPKHDYFHFIERELNCIL